MMNFKEYHEHMEELRKQQPNFIGVVEQAAEQEESEDSKAMKESLARISKSSREETDKLSYLMFKAIESDREDKKAAMEEQIAAEIAEAKKNIKAKYAKQTNAAWAEDEYSKNLRELCKKL